MIIIAETNNKVQDHSLAIETVENMKSVHFNKSFINIFTTF